MAKDWGKVFLSENCNVAIPSSRDILYYILDMSSILLIAFPVYSRQGFQKLCPYSSQVFLKSCPFCNNTTLT